MATNSGQFVKGQHWRKRKAHWSKAWLENAYAADRRSASDIASEMGITENGVYYWLHKHDIPRRSISESRAVKHWGCAGEANPMYGRRGRLNPNWKGGLTPFRQAVYALHEWRKFSRDVRKRDKACRLCGEEDGLEIHHIDPFSQAPLLVMDIGNVILLCKTCHRKMKGKEGRWKRKLYRLVNEERR